MNAIVAGIRSSLYQFLYLFFKEISFNLAKSDVQRGFLFTKHLIVRAFNKCRLYFMFEVGFVLFFTHFCVNK